jgi:phosphate transport system protein
MGHVPQTSSLAMRALEIDYAQMAALVEAQLADAINAFERRDVALAERVVAGDKRVDALQRKIDAVALLTLEEGNLSKADIREATGAMKVAADLERVGDLAKNVAKRTLVVSEHRLTSATAGVVRMGRTSLRQISDVLNAFGSRNSAAAKAVWGGDDELDELYNSVFHEILLAMRSDTAQIDALTHLVFIAKNFERVGDHATNIAEVLHFLITGDQLTAARPKGDDTPVTIGKD